MNKNSKARNFAWLLVLTSLTAGGAQYYDDDLEGMFGALVHDEIRWDNSTSAVQCDIGTPPCVARGGIKSLRFDFPVTAQGSSSTSAQFINLRKMLPSNCLANCGMNEVWIEWYQFLPATWWMNRNVAGAVNDAQFFALSAGGTNGFEAWLEHPIGPEKMSIRQLGSFPLPAAPATLPDGFEQGPLGTWREIWWHVKADGTHGIMNYWVDGSLDLEHMDVAVATSTMRFDTARLMGPVTRGYASASNTYVDDVFISNRPPVSLMLVLDKSGSMGGLASGNANSLTRIAALKKAAGAFVDTVPAHAGPRDRIGVVTFDTSATLASPLILATGGGLGAINTNVVNNLMPGGTTAIGQALTIAKAQLLADSNPHKVILLFTDGVQNVSPMVEDAALPVDPAHGGFTIGGTEFGPDSHGAFHADRDVQVCVVSIGAATNATFNQRVSQCDDAGYAPIAPFTRDFVCATDTECEALVAGLFAELRGALYGDKLETGAITRNANRFLVSQEDVRVSIVLLWSDPAVSSRALRVTLRSPAPGSVDVDARPFTTDGNGYQVISFPLPLQHEGGSIDDYAGEWGLTVSTTAAPAFQYTSMVMNDNRSIATSYRFGGSDFGAGDVIPVEVTVSQNGIPVRGASVIANVESPNDGVGNVLSTNRTPTGDVNTQGDTLSPAQQKLELLLKDPDILRRLQLVANPDVVLTDPDRDGIYKGTYRRTNVPGKYQFEFLVGGDTTENGSFTRVLRQTVLVRVKPTAGDSALDVKLTDGQGFNSTVSFTPRDRFGNYLGPGYAHLITVSGKGSLVGAPVDNLDGSYLLNVALTDPSTRPDISIGIDGDTVDVRRRPWWLWLLLLLLIPVLN